jgi:hypothetical protein
LRGGPRGFDPGFTCPDLLRNRTGSRSSFVYGAFTRYGRTFQTCSTTRAICNSLGRPVGRPCRPYNPEHATPTGFHVFGLGCSPFARHYSGSREFLYFPPGTQMCHFPGFPPPALCVQAGVTRHYPCRVSPFGDPCFIARLRLHTAYRSLPRPSSAFGAKASTIRPYYLDGIISHYAVFKDRTPRSRGRTKRSDTVAPLLTPEPKALKTE